MWPDNQRFSDAPVEVNKQVLPPTERHLVDVRGDHPVDAIDRSGGWPRRYTPDNHTLALVFDGFLDEVTHRLHEDRGGSTLANICMVAAILAKGILDIPVPCTENTHSFTFAMISLAMASMAERLSPWKAGCAGSSVLSKGVGQLRYGRWLPREAAAQASVQHIRKLLCTGARVSHFTSFPNIDTVFTELPALLFSN